MGESNSETNQISRRTFLRMMKIGATAFLATKAAKLFLPDTLPQEASPPPPKKEEISLPLEFLKWIEDGRKMKTSKDIEMLNNTHPGIDLTYSDNPRIAAIRETANFREKIGKAIGFLDVLKSRRYNWREDDHPLYACNIYAFDFLRLLLSNQAIGSRYNKETGKPRCFGIRDLDWSNNQAVTKAMNQFPFLHSNNIDWWMKKYGESHGWKQIRHQRELLSFCQEGGITLGISSQEQIAEKRKENPGFLGHSFVIFSPTPNSFGLTQSTTNILAKAYSKDSPYFKVNPQSDKKFNFWGHQMA